MRLPLGWSSAGVTLYTVGARKDIAQCDDRSYVSIDGGMSDNPRPITYRSGARGLRALPFCPRQVYLMRCVVTAYTAVLADRPLAAASRSFTIAGKHCESGDVLLPSAPLPEPQVIARLERFLIVCSTA